MTIVDPKDDTENQPQLQQPTTSTATPIRPGNAITIQIPVASTTEDTTPTTTITEIIPPASEIAATETSPFVITAISEMPVETAAPETSVEIIEMEPPVLENTVVSTETPSAEITAIETTPLETSSIVVDVVSPSATNSAIYAVETTSTVNMAPAEITLSESPVAFTTTTTEEEVMETHSEAVANIDDIDLTLDSTIIKTVVDGGDNRIAGDGEATEVVVLSETTTTYITTITTKDGAPVTTVTTKDGVVVANALEATDDSHL